MRVWGAGGAAAANRRIAVSSVAPIQPGMNAPCVLALLGSQPPRTYGAWNQSSRGFTEGIYRKRVMPGAAAAADPGGMRATPRTRIRSAAIPSGSMWAVNALLAVSAALCLAAAVTASLIR